MKKLIITTLAAFVLSSCGYDGSYRYVCQDPEYWESEECNPPICKVDGACTEDLLGFNPSLETVPDTVPTEETIAP
jgi:hypothetical protein